MKYSFVIVNRIDTHSRRHYKSSATRNQRDTKLLSLTQNIDIVITKGQKPKKSTIKMYLWRNMASSSAHLRLDSWCPRPSQESQCFPGQSIRFPQYKYFSWPVGDLLWFNFLNFTSVLKSVEEDNGDSLVEIREENRKRSANEAREIAR